MSSEFELYEKFFSEYKNNDINTVENKKQDNCDHLDVIDENGLVMCTDCGLEISRTIQRDKEWRYYGQSDTKHSSDPNRVQKRKTEERTIFKDVETMDFSDKIVSHANKIYIQVTKGHIFRGNSRKAIIFACIFHSFKLSGKPQTHDRLITIFGLTRKIGLKGLKHVSLHAPKTSDIRTTYITPINLVDEIMDKFKASPEQKTEVYVLYEKIKNKSSRLNRSRPQSTAAALVYYWILSKNKDITLKEFTEKVNLSELTVNKLATEISELIIQEDEKIEKILKESHVIETHELKKIHVKEEVLVVKEEVLVVKEEVLVVKEEVLVVKEEVLVVNEEVLVVKEEVPVSKKSVSKKSVSKKSVSKKDI